MSCCSVSILIEFCLESDLNKMGRENLKIVLLFCALFHLPFPGIVLRDTWIMKIWSASIGRT